MSSGTSPVRLTAPARLARGLKYSAVGPVDVTRGALGVSFNTARSSASWVGRRCRRGQIAAQLSNELAAVGDVVVDIPQAWEKARRARRRPRPLMLFGAGAAVLAVGAVTFSIIRRSTQPEPSPLSPSVDTTPKL